MDNSVFIGFIPIGNALKFPVLTVNSSQVPTASAVTPSYRVYGNSGLMAGQTGSLSAMESGAITAATNASPIVITSVGHGLTTGMKVTISGVLGNTAANGTYTITVVSSSTFSLDGSTGNGAYTSGGTWTTTGLYLCSLTPTQGDGFAQGSYYDVLVIANITAQTVSYMFRFGVI